MSENTENLTIKLLQEMRTDLRDLRADMNKRFDVVDERFDGVDLRIDGVTHMLTLLAGHSHQLEERVEKLETK